eukprot:8210084-Pyramimonas_sp.AAC.1
MSPVIAENKETRSWKASQLLSRSTCQLVMLVTQSAVQLATWSPGQSVGRSDYDDDDHGGCDDADADDDDDDGDVDDADADDDDDDDDDGGGGDDDDD